MTTPHTCSSTYTGQIYLDLAGNFLHLSHEHLCITIAMIVTMMSEEAFFKGMLVSAKWRERKRYYARKAGVIPPLKFSTIDESFRNAGLD